MDLNESVVYFPVSAPRKSQPRIWKQGGRYILPIPPEIGARIRKRWAAEDLFVVIARYDKVKGETLTVKVPVPTVERSVG